MKRVSSCRGAVPGAVEMLLFLDVEMQRERGRIPRGATGGTESGGSLEDGGKGP